MKCIAVVRMLLDVASEDEACDGVSAILTSQMQRVQPNSCLLDWTYEFAGSPAAYCGLEEGSGDGPDAYLELVK